MGDSNYAYTNGCEYFAEQVAANFYPDRQQQLTIGDSLLYDHVQNVLARTQEILLVKAETARQKE